MVDAMTEQSAEDWGDLSDSELLEIDLQQFSTENASKPSSSQCDSSGNTQNNDSMKSPVSRKRRPPPLRHTKRHLSVSLLCEQTWCEMKLFYDFLNPKKSKQEKQRTEVQTGASIHLARELEVHDVVPIKVQTREDSVAVKIINMLNMIPPLEAGQPVREFPVFGEIEGVYFSGVIDELSYNQKGELVLKELKTRRQPCLPGAAQALGHRFQMGLYKLLFDTLVRGQVKKEHILNHHNLSASQALGAAVVSHAMKVGVKVTTFSELVDTFLLILSSSDLPCVDVLQLEYLHQGTNSHIGAVEHSYDESQLRAELRGYLEYWKGQREPRGVDIEEAWKCKSCAYEEICEWRKDRAQVLQHQ